VDRSRIAPFDRGTPNYGWASQLGLELVTGYDSFTMRAYETYMDLVRTNRVQTVNAEVWTDIKAVARLDLLAALNVRYIVSAKPIDLPPSEYVLVHRFERQPTFELYEPFRFSPVFVYENQHVLARGFFVPSIVLADGAADAARLLQNIDARQAATVEGSAADIHAPAGGAARVQVVASSSGHVAFATNAVASQFLVVSEMWHPGWSATLDGRPVPVYRADVTLLGLPVPVGEHRIELWYSPPGWRAGLTISAITAAGVMLLLVLARCR
jgi:hypothetical protein